MSRVRTILMSASVAACAALGACSFFHESLPGDSCSKNADCFAGRELCDVATSTCVPLVDAGPRPDADTTDADTTDADTTDAGIDATPADASIDATADAEVPDAT